MAAASSPIWRSRCGQGSGWCCCRRTRADEIGRGGPAMTPTELCSIELALGIVLPEVYKQMMAPFPIPYLSGNTNTNLWDDAARLIQENLELRAGRSSL